MYRSAALPWSTLPRSRVLVVHESIWARRMLRTLLEPRGYEVLEARGVGEAYTLLALGIERLRVVMTEMILPDGSAVDLIRRVRAHPTRDHARLPVMVWTGTPIETNRVLALEAGAQAFFAATAPTEQVLTAIDALAAANARGITAPTESFAARQG